MGAGQPAVRCRALRVCPCPATGTDQPHRPCGVSCWVSEVPFPFMFYCAWLAVCCLALRSLSVCPPVRQFPGVFSQWACSLLSLCHTVSLLAACRLPVCVQRLCDHSSFHRSCQRSLTCPQRCEDIVLSDRKDVTVVSLSLLLCLFPSECLLKMSFFALQLPYCVS